MAFVGQREICRECWVYMSKSEREPYIINTEYLLLLRLKRKEKRDKLTSSFSHECQSSQEA